MNKRHLIIGIVVLAVIVVAAFMGISTAEKKVETSVREAVEAFGASAKKVSYSFFSGKLVLDDVSYILTIMGIKQDSTIRQIVVTDPDMDAFDPAAPGRPLVAKRIVISGLAQHVGTKVILAPGVVGTAEFTCEEVVIEGWRQNLGRVMELYRSSPWSEAFFAAALDYSCDALVYANAKYAASTVGGEVEFKQGWDVGKLSTKDMHDNLISYDVEKIALWQDIGTMGLEGTIGHIGVTDLRVPSPKLLAAVAEMYPLFMEVAAKAQRDPAAAQALQVRLRARMEPLFKDYFRSTPYASVRVEDVLFRESGDEQPVFTLKSFTNSLSFSLPYRFELGVRDLFVPGGLAELFEGGTPDTPEIPDLGVRDLYLNADLKLGMPAAPELSTLSMDVKVRDLGDVSSVFALKLPEESQYPLLLGPDAEQWFMQLGLGKSRLSYTDGGFLPRLIAALSRRAGMAPDALLPALASQVRGSLGGLPVPGLEAGVAEMLNKPGTLTVELNPSAPLPVTALLAAFMIDPASLGLRVEATPGPKSLLEAIPADMRETAE